MKPLLIFLITFLFSEFASAVEIVSTRFEDSIRSNGIGEINPLRSSTGDKIITMEELEAFRQDNGGYMVFAVDVNEAANGTEKSDSQGVAVLKAVFKVRINNIVYTFDQFSTKTRSSLALKGSTQRQFYYTLTGETGSSRITSNTKSDIYGSSFDNTLSIPVNIDISKATSAWLSLQLVDTNTQLGDPEAYYDYTAGYEDVAIVTYADAVYLDKLKAGRQTAPLVVETDSFNNITSSVYYPSSTDYYLAAYEDKFPNKGDYDFNDVVTAYKVSYGLTPEGKAKTIVGEGYLVARGGSYNHDWHLHIPLPSDATGTGELAIYAPYQTTPMAGYPQVFDVISDINLKVYENILTLFYDPQLSYANTIWYSGFIPGPKFRFTITLDNSLPVSKIGAAPFDPYLFVASTGYEIHLPGKTPLLSYSVNTAYNKTNFKDSRGFPFAMILPQTWLWPNEYVDLGQAYPQFLNFIQSGNQANLDWYKYGISTGLTKHGGKWKW